MKIWTTNFYLTVYFPCVVSWKLLEICNWIYDLMKKSLLDDGHGISSPTQHHCSVTRSSSKKHFLLLFKVGNFGKPRRAASCLLWKNPSRVEQYSGKNHTFISSSPFFFQYKLLYLTCKVLS